MKAEHFSFKILALKQNVYTFVKGELLKLFSKGNVF